MSNARPAKRTSQHLRTTDARLGSPTSIPSSPTSIHSSSSAIFERDIEPMMPPSPPIHSHKPLDPHRIPRARATEQLEQSVPSVLDSAAAILTNAEDDAPERVSVVAPASSVFEGLAGGGSGFASPLSLRSRSPSPAPLASKTAYTTAGGPRADSLTSLNIQLPPSPLPSTTQLYHPISVSLSTGSSSTASASQATLDPEDHPASPHVGLSFLASSPFPQSTSARGGVPGSPMSSPALSISSHPPSPTHVATKRLSFMSYSDLLTSTPASTHTLTSLTTSASMFEPPPHIPSVSGMNLVAATASLASASASAAGSLRGFSMVSPGVHFGGKRDSLALLDSVGGEWEREGLGRGLEERLEGASAGTGTGTTGTAVGTSASPVYAGGGNP